MVQNKCVMRGSCGKKGFFGKPLPCPYDGPPHEVRVQGLKGICDVEYCTSQMIKLSNYSKTFVDQS